MSYLLEIIVAASNDEDDEKLRELVVKNKKTLGHLISAVSGYDAESTEENRLEAFLELNSGYRTIEVLTQNIFGAIRILGYNGDFFVLAGFTTDEQYGAIVASESSISSMEISCDELLDAFSECIKNSLIENGVDESAAQDEAEETASELMAEFRNYIQLTFAFQKIGRENECEVKIVDLSQTLSGESYLDVAERSQSLQQVKKIITAAKIL